MATDAGLRTGRSARKGCLSFLALALMSVAPMAAAADSTVNSKSFLGTYCTDCHGPDKQKGDRRFDQLNLPVANLDTLILLQDIVDQLNLGEMPPKKARQPARDELSRFTRLITREIADGRTRLSSTGGRTVLRRLNQREYINTIGDLFALNMDAFDPTTKFPRDQVVEHLDNIGDTLRTSGYLLGQYLDAAEQIVEKAFGVMERPKERAWRFNDNFRQQPELANPHSKVFNYRYLCLYEVQNTVNHEGGYGPIHGFEKGVPVDGWYEIRVLAHAMNRYHPYNPNIFKMDPDEPFRLGIVPGDVTAGPLHHPQPIEPQLAEVTLGDGDPEWHTMKVWLDAGHTPRFTFPNGAANSRRTWGQILSRYRNSLPESVRGTKGIYDTRPVVLKHGKVPHIRIHEVVIRGPIYDEWPPASHRAVLGDRLFEPARTREILESFATRAYRRPATGDEVERLMTVVARRRKDGRTDFEALKDGLKAVLCSPAFLYLSRPTPTPGEQLNAHALATRLSYFLSASTPDDELTRAANSGKLLKESVLLAQTRRLLEDPRSDAFIAGFLDSWLNLRSLGDMPPDRDMFEPYYAKDLHSAMKTESRLFMRDLLRRNDSIVRFLDADYSFLNKPLAALYGIGDVIGSKDAQVFRRVSFNNPNRGGLLGQGSVLTVSANGIETSPVVRGVWLLENILGTPPPPPPDNVPPIDPDVRGAKSIREILAKHRENSACLECHRKIDPPGFALENFDPIGAWRERYPKGPAIDASGELPGGEKFQNVGDLKKALVRRKDQFARALTEKLLAYACGRRMEPLDRPAIDHILTELKLRKDGMRDLVELVVLSEAFRAK